MGNKREGGGRERERERGEREIASHYKQYLVLQRERRVERNNTDNGSSARGGQRTSSVGDVCAKVTLYSLFIPSPRIRNRNGSLE